MSSPTQPPRFTYGLPPSPENTPIKSEANEGSLSGRNVQKDRYYVALDANLVARISQASPVLKTVSSFGISLTGFIAAGSAEVALKVLRLSAEKLSGIVHVTGEAAQGFASSARTLEEGVISGFSWVTPGAVTNVANTTVKAADYTAQTYSKVYFTILAALAAPIGSLISNGLYSLEAISSKVRKISFDGLLNPSQAIQGLENIVTKTQSKWYCLTQDSSRQLIYDDQKKIEGLPYLKRKHIPLDESFIDDMYASSILIDASELNEKLNHILSTTHITTKNGNSFRLRFSFQDVQRFILLINKVALHKQLSKNEKRDLAQLFWISSQISVKPFPAPLLSPTEYSEFDFSQKVRLFHLINAYTPNLSREESQLISRAACLINSQQWNSQFTPEERKLIECIAISHFNKLDKSIQQKLSLISRQQMDLLPIESREVILSIVWGIIETSPDNQEAKEQFLSLLKQYNDSPKLLVSDPEGVRLLVKFIQKYISEKGVLFIQESLKQKLRVYDLSSEELQKAIFQGFKSLKKAEKRLKQIHDNNNKVSLEHTKEAEELQKHIADLQVFIQALQEAKNTLKETKKDISSLQATPRKIDEIAKDGEELLKKQAQIENISHAIEDLHIHISSSIVSEGRFHTMGTMLGFVPKTLLEGTGTVLSVPMHLMGYLSNPSLLSMANLMTMQVLPSYLSPSIIGGLETYFPQLKLKELDRQAGEQIKKFINIAPNVVSKITSFFDSSVHAIHQAEIQSTIQEAKKLSNTFSQGLFEICQKKSGIEAICSQKELTQNFPELFSQLQQQTSKLSDPTATSILQKITEFSLHTAKKAAENADQAFSVAEIGSQAKNLFTEAPELQKNFSTLIDATKQFTELQSQMATKVETALLLEESQGILSSISDAVPYAKEVLSKTKTLMQNLSLCLKGQALLTDAAAKVTSAQITVAMAPHLAEEKIKEMTQGLNDESYINKALKFTANYVVPTISTAVTIASSGYVVAPLLVKYLVCPSLDASGKWMASNSRKIWYSLAQGTRDSGAFLGSKGQELTQSLFTYLQAWKNHGVYIDPKRRDNFLLLADNPEKKHLQHHVFEVIARSQALENPLVTKLDVILDPRKQLFSSYLNSCEESEKKLIQKSFDTFFSSVYRSCTRYIDEITIAESLDAAWDALIIDLKGYDIPEISNKCSAIWKKIRLQVLEAYSTSVKGELTAKWKGFQEGTILLEDQTTLIDSMLLLYDTLKPDELLMLTPEMFQKLGRDVQKRVREAIRKYSPESISNKISNDITYIVEQFNMLSEIQRKSINTMTLREFHALSIYEQKELLFSLFYSTAFKEMIEKELDRGTPLSAKELFDCYQGAIKIEDGLIVRKKGAKLRLTNKEIKKLLSLIPQVSQEEQEQLTPGKLRAMGDKKMEHAYEIVQKYYPDMIPKGLSPKLPVRKGYAIEERHRVRYSEAISSIFRQLSPHQQSELLLMTKEELESVEPPIRIKYARVLLEKLEAAHANTSLVAKIFAGREEEFNTAISILQKAIAKGESNDIQEATLISVIETCFNSRLLTNQERAEIRSNIEILEGDKKNSLRNLLNELHSLEKNIVKETRKKLRIEDQIEYIEGDISTLQDKNRIKNTSPQSESLVTLKADLARKKTELDICEKEIETCTEKYSHLRSTIEEMTGSLIDDPSSLDIASALQEVAKRHIRNTLFQALSFPHMELNKIFTQKLHSCTSAIELTTISHEISDYIQKNRVSLNQKLSEVHEEMKTLKETIGSKENFQEKANRLRYLQNKVVPMIEIMKEIIDDFEVGTQSLISNTEKRIAILPPPPPKTFWRTLQQKAQAFAHSVQKIASSIFQGIKKGWSKLTTSLFTRRSAKGVAPLKDTRPKKTIEKEKKHDFIQMRVEEFLHPYLSGKVTPSTEDTKRKPLIESLYSQFRKQFPKATETKREIEILALEAYILEAAKGFNRNQASIMDPDDKNNELILRHYIATLQHSLPIDFTNLHMPASEIELRAKNALRKLWTEANK